MYFYPAPRAFFRERETSLGSRENAPKKVVIKKPTGNQKVVIKKPPFSPVEKKGALSKDILKFLFLTDPMQAA